MHGMGDFKKRQSRNSSVLSSRLNNWKMKADEFYRSSEYLWIEKCKDLTEMINISQSDKKRGIFTPQPYTPRLDNPYFLLISFCIENLLKGIILSKNPKLLTNKLNNAVKTHDLEKISTLTDITFTKDEINFFKMGATIITWYGRYPIPTNVNEVIQSAHFDYDKIRNIYLHLYFKLSNVMMMTGALNPINTYIFSNRPLRYIVKKDN